MNPLNRIDRQLLKHLQDGIAVEQHPFRAVARDLGISEEDVIARIQRLLDDGTLTRFGPLFNADEMGGAFCLCAMSVPSARFEAVAFTVNAFPEVAHNYERAHRLNMWFVLACEKPNRIAAVAAEIEAETGLAVLLFPKEAEFYVGLRVPVDEPQQIAAFAGRELA
ncbi:MAG: Lrp/AsnC family transcriptional regulator [Hyphomicrobiales bacterium]|nr:Lrp/AsnC family transcriptional regulator [Hyphomicrobiales bacterium]